MPVAVKRLFDSLYEASDAIKKKFKKPIIARTTKRKLASAYDSAEGIKLAAEKKIVDIRQDLENYDVNALLKAKKEVAETQTLQAMIKQEYLELFGKEMVVEEDDEPDPAAEE